MGSLRDDESDSAGADRDDKHRVEQSRIPAPPSGYSRIDSLDDLEDRGSGPGAPAAATGGAEDPGPDGDNDPGFPVDEGAGDEGAQSGPATDVDPATSDRRSHRWNRKPSIATDTPVILDDSGAGGELEEHPPLPVAALGAPPPLPETVPTEAVRAAVAEDRAVAAVVEEDLVDHQVDHPVRTGEPYEEHGEALRSRRITDLEDDVAELRALGRRGTLDLGLLWLRVAVGAYLAVDGARRLFGWLDGPSLNGFETVLRNTPNPAIGFDEQSAGVVAVGWSVTEIVVGIVLIAGFLTPLVGALGLAVASLDLAFGVTVAGGVHLFADQRGSVAFPAALVAMLVAIILCGPGRYSLDGARGWARRPRFGSIGLLLVGVAVAVLVWALFNGTNPLDSPGNPR